MNQKGVWISCTTVKDLLQEECHAVYLIHFVLRFAICVQSLFDFFYEEVQNENLSNSSWTKSTE